MKEDFLKFVAGVFDVDASKLTLETEYGSIPEWDSLMHLTLIAELYEKYGVDIPIHIGTKLRTLADFYQYIENAAQTNEGDMAK